MAAATLDQIAKLGFCQMRNLAVAHVLRKSCGNVPSVLFDNVKTRSDGAPREHQRPDAQRVQPMSGTATVSTNYLIWFFLDSEWQRVLPIIFVGVNHISQSDCCNERMKYYTSA